MSFRLRRRLWVGYLLLLHIFAAVLVFKTDFLPRLTSKLGNSPVKSDPYIADMLKHQRWMDDAVPTGAVIFLGDSIVQGLATAAVAPASVNYGIGTATTVDLIGALPSYRSLERAGSVVLSIGINDLAHGIQMVLEHPEPSALAEQARIKVEREFDIKLVVGRYLDLYQEVIAAAGAANKQ